MRERFGPIATVLMGTSLGVVTVEAAMSHNHELAWMAFVTTAVALLCLTPAIKTSPVGRIAFWFVVASACALFVSRW